MKEKLVITGGKPLIGNVNVSGAKNAAVAIIPAAILADSPSEIDNLPYIEDTKILSSILKLMNVKTKLYKTGKITIDPSGFNEYVINYELARHMRASYYLLGVLLAKFGKAEISLPGGCQIGLRPIDQHIKGLNSLGAKVYIEHGKLIGDAPNGLTGSDVYLDVVSVGATINIMLAASLAQGRTTIFNAAKEPHVVDTANFLNCMGAKILGAGTDTIKIRGVDSLHGCSYSVVPDQIEAGTLMIAAAATKGDVTVCNIIPHHMEALSAKLIEMGITITEGDDNIRVTSCGRPKAVQIKTMPYPGFPTDLQQPISVLLATANGSSVLVENIFEARFGHINEIKRMGADASVNQRVCVINGVEKLYSAPLHATDLRAGAALVIAGLMAQGVSEIYNVKYIDRGYDRLEEKLISLGADIKRETY